ncbi:CehA/McbA family metallohydrolase [Planosporangium sp. 12N6]|uniref:CehA/McbA family metallohydrolase n=1 Tax=Planosporangium spinosum TaxID=3402278 RepID=UPI003CF549EE
MRTIHSGTWWPDDRAEARYRYLPVDVPAGARRLTVTLTYDTGAGVLDLGCLDPDGRFRGWSGGARSEFTITGPWATPGYLRGPVSPGSWRVILGLHRVPPEGLPWTVRAEPALSVPDPPHPVPAVPADGPADGPGAGRSPARPPARDLPALPGLRWLAGDLHAHTVHSDGVLTVTELAVLAAGSGLDFLAVTDHNTVSHHDELPAAAAATGLVLVPGQELTTDRGHANAYGDIGWVDFRRPADAWVSTVDERGGLLSVNHPLGADFAWLHRLDTRPPLAEVWHSGWWDRTWGAPLAWLLAWGTDTVPVGGSDFHAPRPGELPGRPTTWVACADRTVDGVLAGLAAGRVAVTASPTGPVLVRVGDELVAVDADGTLLVDFTGRRRPVRGARVVFPAAAGPYWLEDHRAQVLAICS